MQKHPNTTRISLGKGKKTFRNQIWSKVYETDGKRHSWACAFFVKMKQDQFTTFDADKNPQVAISTYDMGTGVIRWTILFRVKKDRLEVANEIGSEGSIDWAACRIPERKADSKEDYKFD